MNDVDLSRLHSINSAARKVGVSSATIRYWIRKGILTASYVNNRYYIFESDLQRADQTIQQTPQGRPRQLLNLLPTPVGD